MEAWVKKEKASKEAIYENFYLVLRDCFSQILFFEN